MERAIFPGARMGGEQQVELSAEDRAKIDSFRTSSYYPSEPSKVIVHDHSLVDVFRRSASFQKVVAYLQGCSEAVWRTPSSQRVTKQLAECCPTARFLVGTLFPHLHKLVTDIPLEDQTKQRFGNRAKRTFHEQMESDLLTYMTALVRTLPPKPVAHDDASQREGKSPRSPSHDVVPYFYEYSTTAAEPGQERRERSEEEVASLATELAAYLEDSFGNPTRLDFGSGHELHFFIFMMVLLEELGDMGGTLQDEPTVFIPLEVAPPVPVPQEKRVCVTRLRQDFVFFVFIDAYLPFVRRLQKHYSLEPAGSHGVWGLDDYHHMPYVFGAAQLVDAEMGRTGGQSGHDCILPKQVCDKAQVKKLKDEYLYFTMIDWIYENKIGPFFEHSNTLYNISGVEHWAKIYQGMMKMFGAEVLGKFNVSQHLLFGKHLPWNTKTL